MGNYPRGRIRDCLPYIYRRHPILHDRADAIIRDENVRPTVPAWNTEGFRQQFPVVRLLGGLGFDWTFRIAIRIEYRFFFRADADDSIWRTFGASHQERSPVSVEFTAFGTAGGDVPANGDLG